MTKLRNLFEIPDNQIPDEYFEVLVNGNTIIERIISSGQTTSADQWYDQEKDEWVVLLQGEARILFEDVGEITMSKGDFILIKAHEKHQVTYTSSEPKCVWLAVHGNFSMSV